MLYFLYTEHSDRAATMGNISTFHVRVSGFSLSKRGFVRESACVCVCVRGRKRERKGGKGMMWRGSETLVAALNVCTSMCVLGIAFCLHRK